MFIGEQTDSTGLETLEIFSNAPAINQWLYEKIEGFISGQVLETGSGIGNISQLLLESNPTVSLSDLRSDYCHLLEKKFISNPNLQSIFELDISVKDFKIVYAQWLAKFDTVIALNVIEHIQDDAGAIQNAGELLKENGKLVILVPAGEWLKNGLDQQLGHFKRYSKKDLSELLKTAGLKVSNLQYFNFAAILGWWLSGKIQGNKIIPANQLKLFNRFVPVFRILDWFLKPFAGISLIAVGTKTKS